MSLRRKKTVEESGMQVPLGVLSCYVEYVRTCAAQSCLLVH